MKDWMISLILLGGSVLPAGKRFAASEGGIFEVILIIISN